MVSATGFAVEYALPAGTQYATLALRSSLADPALIAEWTVVLPPDESSFNFVELPDGVADPLLPATDYTITLTASRVAADSVLAQFDPTEESFWRVSSHWVGLGPAGFGVEAVSRVTLPIRTDG